MADCVHKKEYMMCKGGEYCTLNRYVDNDIVEYQMISKAYSDMAKAVKDGRLESCYSYDELIEMSENYQAEAKFLEKNSTMIEVFCKRGMR